MRVRIRLDHGDLRARLRADDNFHAATVEVLDRVEGLRRIELGVANKEAEPVSAARRCFNLVGGNLKRSNRVLPERRPRAG